MKRISLIVIVTLLAGLKALAFTFNVASSHNFTLVGSQTYNSSLADHSLNTYFTGLADEYTGSVVFYWDASTQYQSATYIAELGWQPDLPFPRGEGAFVQLFPTSGSTVVFTVDDNPAPPVPKTIAANGTYYLRSSQQHIVAAYSDLIGYPSGTLPAPPPVRTFVYRWDVGLQQFLAYRFVGTSSVGWQPSPPSIPLGHAAFVVAYNCAGPAPLLDCAQAFAAAGPPNVTLRLTFNTWVDPVSAADTLSYKVFKDTGNVLGGTVNSVTLEFGEVSAPCGPAFSGTPPSPLVQSVLLNVQFLSQPGNVYSVKAPGVLSFCGTPSTGNPTFTLPDSPPPEACGLTGLISSDGTTITYYFAGALADPFGSLAAGTPFTGSFRYTVPQPNLQHGQPAYRGDYLYQSISLTFGSETVTDNGTGVINLYDHGTFDGVDPFGNPGTYPTGPLPPLHVQRDRKPRGADARTRRRHPARAAGRHRNGVVEYRAPRPRADHGQLDRGQRHFYPVAEHMDGLPRSPHHGAGPAPLVPGNAGSERRAGRQVHERDGVRRFELLGQRVDRRQFLRSRRRSNHARPNSTGSVSSWHNPSHFDGDRRSGSFIQLHSFSHGDG
ncbi:MAG: hypothetical protein AAB676_15130 [Verrucomicrobiota bacterium]